MVLFWPRHILWRVEGAGRSTLFRAATMDVPAGLFATPRCGGLRQYFYLCFSFDSGGEFEGVGKEWLLLLLSSSFRASPFVLGGQI